MQYDENAEKYGYEGEMTPIELECNMGKDVNGVEHREPWKAYDIDEVDALLAKKDAEIAELKQKLEDAKATAYAESVNVGMENRKLKRALWMHRAITAKFNKEACKAMREYNPFIGIDEYKWQEVERKCLAKAEVYK
jgi:CMP-2-keto-3-deoxyoctulosonic acid synthetase